MLKKLLISWINEIYQMFTTAGLNGYLNLDIGGFNNTLYSHVIAIMKNVTMPVAYVILSLFFVLELYKASVKVDGAGGGTSFGAEMIFKVMFRMVICKTAVDSSLLIMEAIYGVAKSIVEGMATVVSNQTINGMNSSAITAQINSMELGEQLGMFVELFIIKAAVTIIIGLVTIICAGRFIELYVYVAISPIPIATFPSDDLNQIAKNFLKNFAAVCLQGALIYLVLSFFPVLMNQNILNNTSPWGLLFYGIVLALGVFSSGRWAKSICNAM